MALEVIGPGFGRTGSNSLQHALEQLGFGPCHHMHEVGERPELLPAWDALSRGGKPDWDAMFDGYRAQVDWPGARFWRELSAYYPDAKVVLTIRDPDEWFTSFEATILKFMAARGTIPDPHGDTIAQMCHRLIDVPVFAERSAERAYAIEVFCAHNAEVQATIPSDRLLTYNVREGWEPLCAFLEVDVPGTPFPRINSTAQFNDPSWKPR